jgi:hypothetical protein
MTSMLSAMRLFIMLLFVYLAAIPILVIGIFTPEKNLDALGQWLLRTAKLIRGANSREA